MRAAKGRVARRKIHRFQRRTVSPVDDNAMAVENAGIRDAAGEPDLVVLGHAGVVDAEARDGRFHVVDSCARRCEVAHAAIVVADLCRYAKWPGG